MIDETNPDYDNIPWAWLRACRTLSGSIALLEKARAGTAGPRPPGKDMYISLLGG
jgi:hypothetical protein